MEQGGLVTYIVCVRVCVYRLFTTVYILYLSAHIEHRSMFLQQPRRPAPRRRCPRSDRAACVGRYVLRSFRGPSVSLRFIRSQGQRFLRPIESGRVSRNAVIPACPSVWVS